MLYVSMIIQKTMAIPKQSKKNFRGKRGPTKKDKAKSKLGMKIFILNKSLVRMLC